MEQQLKVIAWFSCGITSAVACKLALDKYGKDNVLVYYLGIKTAHEDNARFIADCEKWYGTTILTAESKKYIDQFEVIEGERYVNGPAGAPCTRILKKEVRWRIESKNPFRAQIFGFEFVRKEVNRAIRFSQQHPHTKPEYPLIEHSLTKQDCANILVNEGIELPAMYRLGFHNNNCIGCVKGGKGYWNLIRRTFPETFDRMAKLEREIGRSCIKGRFLDEMTETEGKHEPPILPDCGNFCEVKHTNIEDKALDLVMAGKMKIGQLSLDFNAAA